MINIQKRAKREKEENTNFLTTEKFEYILKNKEIENKTQGENYFEVRDFRVYTDLKVIQNAFEENDYFDLDILGFKQIWRGISMRNQI